jgi:hypothetical protein
MTYRRPLHLDHTLSDGVIGGAHVDHPAGPRRSGWTGDERTVKAATRRGTAPLIGHPLDPSLPVTEWWLPELFPGGQRARQPSMCGPHADAGPIVDLKSGRRRQQDSDRVETRARTSPASP